MAKLERTYKHGEVLFREGDPGGDIYIIKAGEVKVYQERAGQEVQLAQLGKGELLGAMTATTKTSRTASVKAIGEVSVTIIDNKDVEKLLKDMPPWAKILLKDLIFRLKFMNELYVQSLSHDSSIKDQNELLRSAIRLSKGILANAKVQRRKIEGTVVVDLSSAFSPLLELFLSEKGTFLRIYNLFLESNLLELMRLRIPGKFLSKDELNGLQIFYDMANAHLAFAHQNRSVETLAQNERKILFETALWAKGLLSSEAVDSVSLPLAQLEDKLAMSGVKRLNIFPLIQRSASHGMLVLDKEQGSVIIHPDKMRHIIASMNVILALQADQKSMSAG